MGKKVEMSEAIVFEPHVRTVFLLGEAYRPFNVTIATIGDQEKFNLVMKEYCRGRIFPQMLADELRKAGLNVSAEGW